MKEITYLQTVEKGYILGAQTLNKKFVPQQVEDKNKLHAEVISKEENDKLLEIFKTSPKAEEGFEYRLKTDLTWEKYEVPIVKEEGEEQ